MFVGLLAGDLIQERNENIANRPGQDCASEDEAVVLVLLPQSGPYLLTHFFPDAEIETAIWRAGRAYANDARRRQQHRLDKISRGSQQPLCSPIRNHAFQSRFNDGTPARVDHLYLVLVYINSPDFISSRSQAGGRYTTHVAESEDADPHFLPLYVLLLVSVMEKCASLVGPLQAGKGSHKSQQ